MISNVKSGALSKVNSKQIKIPLKPTTNGLGLVQCITTLLPIMRSAGKQLSAMNSRSHAGGVIVEEFSVYHVNKRREGIKTGVGMHWEGHVLFAPLCVKSL